MTDDEIWAVYEALWKRAEDSDVSVGYVGLVPRGEGGWFHPNDDRGGEPCPVIRITRPYYQESPQPSRERVKGAPLPPPDLRDELCILAHEYGHSCGWEVHRTPVYRAAVDRLDAVLSTDGTPPLTEDEKNAIRAEERRAWLVGRVTLRALGFTDWELYDAKESHGLEEYERIFRGEVKAE